MRRRVCHRVRWISTGVQELPYIGVLKPEVYGGGESDEDIKTKAKKPKN